MDKKDFQGMKFDVFKDLETAIWVQYPVFKTRPDLCQVPAEYWWKERGESVPTWKDLDLVLRFVILFCSMERANPLSVERDLVFRRDTAKKLVGIIYGDHLVDMIDNWHPWVVGVMSVFMKMENSVMYNTWLSLLASYYQEVQYLMMPASNSDDPEKVMQTKARIKANMERAFDELNRMATRVFPTMEVADELTKYETGVFDGIGSYAEYMVAKDWPMKKL